MFQIRFYGRCGQGVVTGAEILASAGFCEGKHAHAFPAFMSERIGTPIVSFCRLDEREILDRAPVEEPDCIILMDPTLLDTANVFQGLKPKGFVLINSSKSWEALSISTLVEHLPRGHVVGLNANGLARQHIGQAIPNSGLLGAFAAMTNEIHLDALETAISAKFGGRLAAGNIVAARAAHATTLRKHLVSA